MSNIGSRGGSEFRGKSPSEKFFSQVAKFSQPHYSACTADEFGMYCSNIVVVLSFVNFFFNIYIFKNIYLKKKKILSFEKFSKKEKKKLSLNKLKKKIAMYGLQNFRNLPLILHSYFVFAITFSSKFCFC